MKIKNLTQAEEALKRVAEIESLIAAVDATASEQIAHAKAQAEEATRGLADEHEKLIESLELYADDNREELFKDGKKSAQLINGEIGFRKGTDKVVVSAETASLLESLGFGHCVKVTKEPVKAALKNFTAEQLESVKAKIEQGAESFFVKAKSSVLPKESA